MFVIEDNVLKKLKCVCCENYVSCGPVYLRTDGSMICGRCPAEGTRCSQFEVLASQAMFPCRFKDNGCLQKVSFHQVKQHEKSCLNRPSMKCPLALAQSQCAWRGENEELLTHCRAKHPKQELKHPAMLEHDIKQNKMQTFFIYVYQVLFLVQTKVCTASSKMYHCVRQMGEIETSEENSENFTYELQINNSAGLLYHRRAVAPLGNLKIKESCAIVTNLTAVLGVLKSLENTTFKLSISENISKTEKNLVPSGEPCENHERGCNHRDISDKLWKHQWYYCPHTTLCELCYEDIDITLEEHYNEEHDNIICASGEKWPAKIGDWEWQIVTSPVGILLCNYHLTTSTNTAECIFSVRSPLHSKELHKYQCEVSWLHPTSDRSILRTLDVRYDEERDWYIHISSAELRSVISKDGCCDVIVNIVKKTTR